jgi:mitogen-activated protein kinase 15
MVRRLQAHERIDRDVTSRYAVGNRIGRGCYGVVYEVHRHEDVAKAEKEEAERQRKRKGSKTPPPSPIPSYALKKVLSAFNSEADAQRTYREISYLLHFKGHPNILNVVEVFCSPDDRHVYVVSGCFDSDLQKALRTRCIRPVHRPFIVYQAMRALKYVHSAKVMHRDVKPSNLMINANCRVALGDFGWARLSPMDVENREAELTDYASTRWYRAPEMLLGARHYDLSIDMWAMGCITAEVCCETPLFPGTSTIDMWDKQLECLGKPSPTDVEAMNAEYAAYVLNTWPLSAPGKPMGDVLPKDVRSEELLDFLDLLMQYNPNKRMTSAEAVEHPYLRNFHNPDDEPDFGRVLALPLPDATRFHATRYRDQVYADVLHLPGARARVDSVRRTQLLDGLDASGSVRSSSKEGSSSELV